MKKLAKLISMILLCVFLAALTSCNTIEGAGEDIERAGEEIQETAD